MDEHPIDLSPLDPAADAAHWERLVRAITAAAAPELARRAEARSVFAVLGHWLRPALAAGVVLAVIAAGTLTLFAPGRGASAQPTAGLEEALQLSAPVSLWLFEDRTPTTSDMLLVLEGELP